jgi:Fe-S-cluster-containing hydrogenase component 2
MSCRKCNKACPMSLDIANMVNNENMENTECILCGECTKTCRFGAVKRVYGRKGTCGSSNNETSEDLEMTRII